MLNLTLGYKFDNDLRVRLQVKNLEDERAPLADEDIGVLGRSYIQIW